MNREMPRPPEGMGTKPVTRTNPRAVTSPAPAGSSPAASALLSPSPQWGRHWNAEARLVRRVFDRCHAVIREASARSSVPAEFLGALTANESGGDPRAARFEPAVYRHLAAVASGASPRYGGVRSGDLSAELAEMLHPKDDAYHQRFLTAPFGANHQREFAALADEALRELATSWGYTQIMGYHMVGRAGTVRDLLDPQIHFRVALELLAEFAEEYQLNLAHEFEEMFRCWNTGQPYGPPHGPPTTDPEYVANGLTRMNFYAKLLEVPR
jgi:hypothetical protein